MRDWWKDLVARKWFPLVVLLAVLFAAMAVYSGVTDNDTPVAKGNRGLLVPAQKVVTHGAVAVANVYNRVFFYDDLLKENEELKKQVSELRTRLNDSEDALKENEELRKMLGVAERGSNFEYETAEVVARQMDEWSMVLTIDAGKKDGLAKNNCVVNSDGLIGYITSISAHSAEVTTILDPNLQAGAKITGTDEIGVAKGDYSLMSGKQLKVTYLAHGSSISKGSTVETSGSGGVFPEGLVIGTVKKVCTESDGMSDYAVIEPSADITSATRVFIITDYSVSN